MTPQQVQIYTTTLKDLVESFKVDPPVVHNRTWLDKYDWSGSVNDEEKYAIYLALIHPDLYTNRNGSDISMMLTPPHPPTDKRPSFREDNRNYKCELNVILPTATCPWQKIPGAITMDHKWPYSLGGPSILSNRFELCYRCNTQKSSSYNLYPTDSGIPSWLSDRVKQLLEMKE